MQIMQMRTSRLFRTRNSRPLATETDTDGKGRNRARPPDSCHLSRATLRERHNDARVIPNFCILFCRVVRLSPRRSAAPPLPAILPEEAFNAFTIALRSAC